MLVDNAYEARGDHQFRIEFPSSGEKTGSVFLAPGIDGSRFLPVLRNSIRNWWSRTLCNLTREGPLVMRSDFWKLDGTLLYLNVGIEIHRICYIEK